MKINVAIYWTQKWGQNLQKRGSGDYSHVKKHRVVDETENSDRDGNCDEMNDDVNDIEDAADDWKWKWFHQHKLVICDPIKSESLLFFLLSFL